MNSSTSPSPWFSYRGQKYNEEAPPYFAMEGVKWFEDIQAQLPRIKLLADSFLRLDDLDVREYFNKALVEGTRWESIVFMFWKLRNEHTIEKGRDLFEIFRGIPGLVSLSISILQPHTHIKGHYGDTNAIYRLHIPVYIPSVLPACGLAVSGIKKPWERGTIIAFCDAHFHEAWNYTDQPRIIIIMDVIRPEFLAQSDEVCANVLSFMRYQQVSARYTFIRKFPGWAKDILRRLLKRFYPVTNLS